VRGLCEQVVDPSGLVRADMHVSEAQDYVIRSSSCYSNSMLALLREALDRLGLDNPLARFDYARLIERRFLVDDRLEDDLSRRTLVSTDAAIAPFWAGVFADRPDEAALYRKVLARLDRYETTTPIPARYVPVGTDGRRMVPLHCLNPWQSDALWTNLGLHLLEVTRRLWPERYREDLRRYARLIERIGCFPELLEPGGGGPFESLVYLADDSMIWAGIALEMPRSARTGDMPCSLWFSVQFSGASHNRHLRDVSFSRRRGRLPRHRKEPACDRRSSFPRWYEKSSMRSSLSRRLGAPARRCSTWTFTATMVTATCPTSGSAAFC